MRSLKLLDEIMRLDNIVETNIYTKKKQDPELKKGLQEYLKESALSDLGNDAIDLIL